MIEEIKKINYIFDKKKKVKSFFITLGLFIGALSELLGISLITGFITLLGKPEVIHTTPVLAKFASNLNSDRDFFTLIAVYLALFYLYKNLFLFCINGILYKFIYKSQLELSGRLVDCYLKKPYTFHLDTNSGDIIRNIMLDTERFFQMILTVFLVISELLVSIFLSVYLIIVDPVISAFIVAILVVFSIFYLLLFKNKVKKYGKINQYYDGKMNQAINQALGAVKDIKILKREKYFSDAYVQYGKKKLDAQKNGNVLEQVPKYLIEAVCICLVIGMLMYNASGNSSIEDMLPKLAAFAICAFKLLPSVSKINNFLNHINFLRPSVDLIYRDIKDTEDMIAEGKGTVNLHFTEIEKEDMGSNSTSSLHKIAIKNLTYRYPNTETDVLSDVSFEIKSGSSIGIIGASGSGKSTLADVILGILTPTSGGVFYDNMNVHENPFEWSKKLAYIPQSIYLSDDTIRNNVAFGVEKSKIDDKKVWEALTQAKIDDYVKELEAGLDSVVGEMGVRISGGQRQRIGIARALYNNPEILVLDEATSALDNDTESHVMQAIDSLIGTKTLIIIAHRLTTIMNCDYIYKVENKKVIPVDKSEIKELVNDFNEKEN